MEMKIYLRLLQVIPFFRAFRTRVFFRVLLSHDLSRLPQLGSLLAGYVLPSQFVDDSYAWVIRLSLSLSNGLPVNGVKQFVFVLFLDIGAFPG